MCNRFWRQSTDNGTTSTHKYIVDTVGDLPVILCEIDTATSSLTNSYVYANSQVLVQHTGDWSAPKYFYMHDRLGSVRQVFDYDAGRSPEIRVKNIYTYDAFGKRLTGTSLYCYETVYNPFQFTGQWYDAEIGQYYLRARMYDPQLARFTARDPVLGGSQEPMTLHQYLYCVNDPVNRIDRNGKFAVTLSACGSGNFNMNDLVNALNTIKGNGLFDAGQGLVREGLVSGFFADVAAYTMLALPFFTTGALGFGGEVGVGIAVARDEDAQGGFWDGWDIGDIEYIAGGVSANTGKGYSVSVNVGYSPNAQNLKDLKGLYAEFGGSVSVPPVWLINQVGASWSRNYDDPLTPHRNKKGEIVDLWSVSFGKSSSIGAEGHAYVGYTLVHSWVND